jgi:hypothetical protein
MIAAESELLAGVSDDTEDEEETVKSEFYEVVQPVERENQRGIQTHRVDEYEVMEADNGCVAIAVEFHEAVQVDIAEEDADNIQSSETTDQEVVDEGLTVESEFYTCL